MRLSRIFSPGMKIEEQRLSAAIPARAVRYDCLFLGLVVLLSLVLYVRNLGFYVDDWAFLRLLHSSSDPSFSGLVKALYSGDIVIRQRPVQVITLAGLYWLFGLDPLGYHLANAAVLMFTAVLFYLVLRELAQPRLVAVALPLVYILLPHYSTDRFWIAAFQATLSIPLYLLSLYADLRSLRVGTAGFWGWRLVSLLALLGSGLAYEVALPLFLLNPLLVWYRARNLHRAKEAGPISRPKIAFWAGSSLLALLLVAGYKALTTVRVNIETSLLSHLIYLFTGAVWVNFGTYGLGLPYVVGWILRHHPGWLVIVLGCFLSFLVIVYLSAVQEWIVTEWPHQRYWACLIGLGLVVFILGYTIFSINADVWFTSASLGNRIAIAAALGVAMAFVGCIGWASSLLRLQMARKRVFSFLVAGLCASGFLINNTLAAFWAEAYQRQQAILEDIQEHVPNLPAGSTLILHGVCLEHGGAYLFTGKRDLAGALSIAYQDQSLWATASERSPRVEPEGISITVYGRDQYYPYTDKLLLYDYSHKRIDTLTDAASAGRVLQRTDFIPERDCPPGFAWGVNE